MPLTTERKLPLILFFVVIVLTALGFALYEYTTSLQDAVDIQKRTQDVVRKLDDTLRLTLDVDSALSSFIITGNDSYLDPYERAKVRLPQNLAELRTMTANASAETEDLARLQEYTTEYLAQVESKIQRRKIDGFDATIQSLNDSPERLVTANIRATIDRLKSSELGFLQRQDKNLDNRFNQTIWVFILGCVAGIFALAFANIVVSREIGRRRQAETALLEANKNLEAKVDERTAELEKVNESLLQGAEEREILLRNEQEARREAEIANRLRDEFMATVSHELKTPLNSILGWARMLKGGDLDDEQSKRALGTIIKNSETQNRLIEDLLDVARIISGKLVLETEEIKPSALLHDAIESIRPSAATKRVLVRERFDPEIENVTISGDRNRLAQVFSNLLTNAVKFTQEQGCIELSAYIAGNAIEIHVRDNGIGISPEFLPLVFERFRQDTSVTTRNGGLGLGLAIVRQLVEMHGGSVSVSSDGVGKGSDFTVTLPVQPTEGHPL